MIERIKNLNKKYVITSLFLLAFVLVLYFIFSFNTYNIEWVGREVEKNNNRFYVKSYYHTNRRGKRIKPNKILVLLNYNKWEENGGFKMFLRKQFLSHNNIHMISILSESDSVSGLIEDIHDIIRKLNINKYSIFYGNICDVVLKSYIEKYEKEILTITHLITK